MRPSARPTKSPSTGKDSPQRQAKYLPNEMILRILSYVPRAKASQAVLWALCLVSRQWYNVAISRLYEEPWLEGRNFMAFVNTICPSRNLHVKKSELAGLVRVLDLRRIVHLSTRSITARLLSRTKSSLEVFIAPQAAFAVNCFAGLCKCTKLQLLDLSLVCEAVTITALTRALAQLPVLRTLRFPRSLSDIASFDGSRIVWPPLETLCLSGRIDGRFLRSLRERDLPTSRLPASLKSLSITFCPRLAAFELDPFLDMIGPQLKSLTVEGLFSLGANAMDRALDACPGLESLRVALENLTFRLIQYAPGEMRFDNHPLERLELGHAGPTGWHLNRNDTLKPRHLADAVASGCLPNLRIIRVSKSAMWDLVDMRELQRLSETVQQAYTIRYADDALMQDRVVGVWVMDD